ncbi:hypothetical protein IMZ48_11685 [Candidatus Bathyarchaeota archaeon]|nr:hypothetical protein [Candidatus Bathyarchaeota archaeon]
MICSADASLAWSSSYVGGALEGGDGLERTGDGSSSAGWESSGYGGGLEGASSFGDVKARDTSNVVSS